MTRGWFAKYKSALHASLCQALQSVMHLLLYLHCNWPQVRLGAKRQPWRFTFYVVSGLNVRWSHASLSWIIIPTVKEDRPWPRCVCQKWKFNVEQWQKKRWVKALPLHWEDMVPLILMIWVIDPALRVLLPLNRRRLSQVWNVDVWKLWASVAAGLARLYECND